MQDGPTEEAQASIPTEHVRDDVPNLNRTFTVRRKAAKRTDHLGRAAAGNIHFVRPLLLQAEDIPARKKPRLDPITKSTAAVVTDDVIDLCSDSSDDEKPKAIVDTYTISSLLGKKRTRTHIATSTAQGATKTVSPDVAMTLPPDDGGDSNDVNTDSVKDTLKKDTWTPQQDAKLSAATSICKTKHGKKDRIDWAAVAALVPDRTKKQCCRRWYDVLIPGIDRATGHKGKWTEDEDSKLKDAVQKHGGENWGAIAALVPDRTTEQCYDRWRNVLNPNIDRTSGRTDNWTAAEESKLKDAVQTQGDKNWGAIAALVPERTPEQCYHIWHNVLDPSVDRANGRKGMWTEDEDSKLKDAVQTQGGKKWGAIAALVPGRSYKQCYHRWHHVLKHCIDLAPGRTDHWTAVEDIKLKDAVQTYGGNNWGAIAVLVPGRSHKQCYYRWHYALDPSLDQANGRTGKWTEDEDSKLKDAVQMHGGNNWAAIAALVPGRKQVQCRDRWHRVLDPECRYRAGSGSNAKTML
jgi:hypothetical protein